MPSNATTVEAYARLAMARLALGDKDDTADHYIRGAMALLQEVFPGIAVEAARLLMAEGVKR